MRFVRDDLKVARNICERAELPPFADLAQRFFPVLPMPSALRMDRGSKWVSAIGQLADLLEAINARGVIPNWSHLRDIKSTWVVAGTDHKVAAIWTLLLCAVLELQRPTTVKPIIDWLVVDEGTASMLATAKERYNLLSESEKKLYEKLIAAARLLGDPSKC